MVEVIQQMLAVAGDTDYDAKLKELLKYVDSTWFNSSTWSSKEICSYQRLVRTNNDYEGYHRRLKERCGTAPPIYRLIESLHSEALLVDYACKLVSTRAATTTRRKKRGEASPSPKALGRVRNGRRRR